MIGFTPSIGLVTKLRGARKLVDRRRTGETFYSFYIYILVLVKFDTVYAIKMKSEGKLIIYISLLVVINVNLYFYVDIVLGYGYFEQLIYYDARITFIRVAICIIVDPLLRLRLLSSVLNDKSNRNNFIPTIKSFFRFYLDLFVLPCSNYYTRC